MGPNKAVVQMFLTGGVVLFFLMNWTGDWIWGYFTRHPPEGVINVIAGIAALTAGVILYNNDRVYGLASDVASELKKVTWPTRKETQAATLIVIVTVIIATIILGAFDAVWSAVTDSIYG